MTVLTRTWLILVVLTIVSLWAGRAEGGGDPGLAGAALVMVVAGFKAERILRHFLELDRATRGWRVLFHVCLIGIIGTILAIHALAPLLI